MQGSLVTRTEQYISLKPCFKPMKELAQGLQWTG